MENMEQLILYGGCGVFLIAIILWSILAGKGKKKQSGKVKTTSQSTLLGLDKAVDQNTTQEPSSSQPPQYEVVSKDGIINAVVMDDITRSFGERHVELIKGKDYGRPLSNFGNTVFWLHRLSTGQIEPVPATPYENLEHSPSETYEAVNNEDDLKTLFGKRVDNNKTKIVWLIIGTIACLFIAWMAVNGGD